jgi:hypothetical protein
MKDPINNNNNLLVCSKCKSTNIKLKKRLNIDVMVCSFCDNEVCSLNSLNNIINDHCIQNGLDSQNVYINIFNQMNSRN